MRIAIFSVLLLVLMATAQATEEWEVDITAVFPDRNVTSTFGVKPGATLGFDNGIDELCPPTPMGAQGDAYFYCSECGEDLNKLSKDYINRSYLMEWIYMIEIYSLDSITVNVTWNKTQVDAVPEYYSVEFITDSETIDMRTQHSYQFSGSYGLYTFTIKLKDVKKPDVSIRYPSDGSVIHDVVSVNGTVWDEYFDYYKVTITNESGVAVVEETFTTSVQDGILYTWDTTTYPDGQYTITVTAYDKAANSNSTQVNVTVDNTPPEITNMRPTGEIFSTTLPTDVTISANFTDNTGIDVVVLKLNGTNVTSQATITQTGVSYSFMASEGNYTVYLEVWDKAGNMANTFWNFTVEKLEAVTVNISLKKGWNMISIPVSNATFNIPSAVVGNAYWYNPKTRNYKQIPVNEMEPGKGYWVLAKQDCNITVTGMPVMEYTANLTRGWNMIGAVYSPVNMDNIHVSPENSVIPYVFWYNPSLEKYEIKYTLEPCKGYWSAAVQDCQLTVSLT